MVNGRLTSVVELAKRVIAGEVSRSSARFVVGIAGPPGAGKSTLAGDLRDQINLLVGKGHAEIAPMDGFHFTNVALEASGRLDRKGELDTFDVNAYVRLLRTLRYTRAGSIPWPTFDREKHDPIPGGVVFVEQTTVVITEGNYLLIDGLAGWSSVRANLDEAWYLDASKDVIEDRLFQRQIAGGKSVVDARNKVFLSDIPNSELIADTKHRADVVLRERGGHYYIERGS
ncbi:MAG: nucleoside/nucleotide kinase family protein [Pseudonocardia sp.]